MMRAALIKVVLGIFGCTLCVPGVGGFPPASAESTMPIAIVVAKSSPLTNLSLYQLKHLYLGELLTDPDGKRLIPLNQPVQSYDRSAFDANVLGMSPDQQASYWIDRRIRGLSGSPRTVDSGDLAQRIVARLDGAVAYLPISAVRPDVKVVRVEGKLPGDPGYRLR